jgi:DNA modification methylase
MANGRNVSAMQGAAEDAGFRIHTVLVWDKRRCHCQTDGIMNVTASLALFMFKGQAKTINNRWLKDIWFQCPQRDEAEHPTEKPVALMALLDWQQQCASMT